MTCPTSNERVRWSGERPPSCTLLGFWLELLGGGANPASSNHPASSESSPSSLPPSNPPSPNCHFKPGRPASHSEPFSPVWCGPCCPGSWCQVWPWGCMGAGSRRTLLEQGLRFVSPASVSLPSPSLCQAVVARWPRLSGLSPSFPMFHPPPSPSMDWSHRQPNSCQGRAKAPPTAREARVRGQPAPLGGWLTSRARGAPCSPFLPCQLEACQSTALSH